MSNTQPPPADATAAPKEFPIAEDGPTVVPPSWTMGGVPASSVELPQELPWWKQQAGREEGTPLPGLGASISRQISDDQARSQG